MTPKGPPSLDATAAVRWQRSPPTPSAWLHEEVARRMEERLAWINLQPSAWVHWEPVRGGLLVHERLAKRYPKSRCFIVEPHTQRLAYGMKSIVMPWWRPSMLWRRWNQPAPQAVSPLALPPASAQMLWANMQLHLSADPQGLMQQWLAALAPGGFLMFSCLGPDTLREVRGLYQRRGWPAPAHLFTDMHDWGDMLAAAGFAEPVMDMERISLTYASPSGALAELRSMGRNLSVQRFAGLRGRGWRTQLGQAMATELTAQDGRLALDFEIIYGHAFKPQARFGVQAQSQISLQDMRQMLGQGPSQQ